MHSLHFFAFFTFKIVSLGHYVAFQTLFFKLRMGSLLGLCDRVSDSRDSSVQLFTALLQSSDQSSQEVDVFECLPVACCAAI